MKDRIAHIMRAKNLKATDFAALLGIQPSGVSHILAGRNNPSLEFVKKIKETFPEYNLDWIIFGTGPMTTSEPFKISPDVTPASQEPDEGLFSNLPEIPAETKPVPVDLDNTSMKSLIVLYQDGTFEQFAPR